LISCSFYVLAGILSNKQLQEELMESIMEVIPEALPGRVIFLSYRSIDDDPPPENQKGRYVEYLWRQLRWELNRLGVPKATLWRDRNEICPGDKWAESIRGELRKSDLFVALLSRNYIESEWCEEELSTMVSRVSEFDENLRHRRIFRADKNRIPDERVPLHLREIQAVRFYDEDKEYKREDEFFYRGKIIREDKYFDAVRALAESIHNRLEELGVQMRRASPTAKVAPIRNTGRVVYVAKPALDMIYHYKTLTNELIRSGFRVLPDVEHELPEAGENVRSIVVDALNQSELSVHLLGERLGGRPDGLDEAIGPFQLKSAAASATNRGDFSRIIWAPKLFSVDGTSPPSLIRDPFEVLSRFGRRLDTDQVDSDLPAKFNEFVVQRLERRVLNRTAAIPRLTNKTAYLHCALDDRQFALAVAKELKKNGFAPVIRPQVASSADDRDIAEAALMALASHVVLCWERAPAAALLKEFSNRSLNDWRAKHRAQSIPLIIGPPKSTEKMEVVELGGIGEDISTTIDATDDGAIAGAVRNELIPFMEKNLV
jgi:hypothetical protein